LSRNTQSRLRGVKTQGKTRILGVALLAALLALLVAGCSKVTGGGQFVSAGIGEASAEIAYVLGLFTDVDTTGDKVSFGFTAQPTDAYGDAKGQVTLTDKTFGIAVSAALTFTFDGSGPVASYAGEGTAKANQMGGPGKLSQWDIFVFAYDGNGDGQPDYVEVLLVDPNSGFFLAWSGEVVHGNIVVH